MTPILRLLAVLALSSAPARAQTASGGVQKQIAEIRSLLTSGDLEKAAAETENLEIPDSLGGPEKAALYQNRADLYLRLGDGDAAVADLRSALEFDAGNVERARALGLALFSRGRAAEALIFAEHVCLNEPAGAAKETRAADLVERAQVEMALDLDDRAEDDLKAALKLSRENAQGLRATTDFWIKKGRPSKGRSYADRLVEATRTAAAADRAAALGERARLWMSEKEFAKAEADLKEALAAVPGDGGSREAMAQCLIAQGRDAEAAGYSSGAALAQLQFKLGDSAKAEDVLAGVLKSNPGDLEALDGMIKGLAGQGRFKDALPFADRAVAASQAFPGADRARQALVRANLELRLGDFAKAQDDAQKAVDADPRSQAARLVLAAALDKQAKFKEALEALNGAGDSAELLTTRFVIALESGDKNAAEAALKAAVARDPRQACLSTPAFVNRSEMDLTYFDACVRALPSEASLLADRGVARYLKGQRDGAIADLTEALRLKPDDLEAAMSLCAALKEGTQPDKARAVIAKALSNADKRKGESAYREALAVQASLMPGP